MNISELNGDVLPGWLTPFLASVVFVAATICVALVVRGVWTVQRRARLRRHLRRWWDRGLGRRLNELWGGRWGIEF